tara:strand:- start:740 stop:1342 length:603 start_codon:yes stop_codon:yes gene_type:complete
MNLKNLVQIFLIIIIILISYLFYKNYFTKDINIEKQITVVEADKELLSTEQTTNIIENLEYSSLDRDGNKYTIKANYAEVTSDNENILILTKVIGIIYLKEKGEIFIYSDKAEYNKINFDTKFYNNVKVNYDDSEIFSDNLDIFFKDNKAIMYNKIILDNAFSNLEADIINFDLVTGNIEIKMYSSNENVIIKKKQNGNN